MKNIISAIILLSVCFSANAEKTYTTQQLHSMINAEKYPELGAVITQTKSISFDACVDSLSVITSSVLAHYPVKNIVNTDLIQTIKLWSNDGMSTFTCMKNSSQVIVTNAPYL